MIKKITILAISALLLGGCTLLGSKPNETGQGMDESLIDSTTPTSESTEIDSLKADINNTVIFEEDFSDLE